MARDALTEARLSVPLLPAEADDGALARLYGEPLFDVPPDLYIPPDALKVFLESFEGPLDLLLWLIRRQRFDVLDIPLAALTEQYMAYIELIRGHNLELAAEYLVMAATLTRIKSGLLLPVTRSDSGEEIEDPQAELERRLREYERIKFAAYDLEVLPRVEREFWYAHVPARADRPEPDCPLVPDDLLAAWEGMRARAQLSVSHQVSREELSVRDCMGRLMRRLAEVGFIDFLVLARRGGTEAVVSFVALLELARQGLVAITQAAPYAPLYVVALFTGREEAPEGEGVGEET